MDVSAPSSSGAASGDGADLAEEIQWRFSQIKGNIETEDAPTDGLLLF